MHSDLTVGHSAAIAGRSIPAIGRRMSFDIAMKAPVLPAETATSASPFCTASIASHRLEPLPRRKRLAGLVAHGNNCIGVDDARAPGKGRCLVNLGGDLRLVAEEQETQVRMTLERERRAGDHDLGAVISTHGVKRYRPRLRHVAGRLVVISDR